MANDLQTKCSNAFCSMEIFEFHKKINGNMFLGAVGSISALVQVMAWHQAITWTGDLDRCHMAPLGHSKLYVHM